VLNSTVLYLLGWALFCLTVLLGVAALAAVTLDELSQASQFFINMCISGFVSGALIVGFHGRAERMRRSHTLWLMTLVWVTIPLFGAAPLLSHYELETFTRALFESVSGLTTTGASLVYQQDTMPTSLVLWRALLQWFGGALTLLTAVLVLAPYGVLSTPINITIPGYEKDDLARSVVATGRHVMPAYVLLTVVCAALLWMLQVPPFDAVCLAMSTVSTGGFVPNTAGIAAYDSFLTELVLMIFMVAGATSFLAHRAVIARVAGTHADNRESWYLLFLILIGAGLLSGVSSIDLDAGEASGVEKIRYALFRSVSLLTTTGFDSAPSTAPGIPFVLVCTAIAIGGAAFSTAGGLKIFRMFAMLTQSHRELKRLIHPRSVTRARSTGKPIDVQIMKTIWSTFFLFVFAVSVLSIVLGVEGVRFDEAMMAAIAAMSNTGPALELAIYDGASSSSAGYAVMTQPSLWALMVGMILGRIEFVVVLSLAFVFALRH
jgi:trk system potassium uptake protein TrkH